MSPALRPGDYLLTRPASPRRGDVIVFEHPARSAFYLVKRVVGMPGEWIEIRSGKVFIDGVEWEDPWTADTTEPPGSWELDDDEILVLGDARHRSTDDGRTLGPLPLAKRAEVVWFRYWPPAQVGRVG